MRWAACSINGQAPAYLADEVRHQSSAAKRLMQTSVSLSRRTYDFAATHCAAFGHDIAACSSSTCRSATVSGCPDKCCSCHSPLVRILRFGENLLSQTDEAQQCSHSETVACISVRGGARHRNLEPQS